MQQNLILQYAMSVLRGMSAHRYKALCVFIFFSFTVLAFGMWLPASYSTSITIYADSQNIIKPLLEKRAAVTSLKQDRIRVVRDVMYSPRILTQVVHSVYGSNAYPGVKEMQGKLTEIRGNLRVEGLSGSYIKITYKNERPEKAYELIGKVVALFIEDIAKTKRTESKSAYQFIDQQVKSYKSQLLTAESRLKAFSTANLDGTQDEVDSRIAQLRAGMEELKINIDSGNTRVSSLNIQLYSEKRYKSNDYTSAVYYDRLKQLEQSLSIMLVSYKEDYPGVIELRYQIEDAKKAIVEHSRNKKSSSELDTEFNPLYSELRSKLSEAKVDLQSMTKRLLAFERLLEDEYGRRARIANNQAELAELTRDYSVNSKLYDDMLERKEKARLSMVLDIQGQGVNYKIQEPADFPSLPTGARFGHFVVGGPVLGGFVVIGLFVALVILDPKIRFASRVQMVTSVPVIANVPRVYLNSEISKKRFGLFALLLAFVCIMLVYLGIAVAYRFDINIPTLLNHLESGANPMELFSYKGES